MKRWIFRLLLVAGIGGVLWLWKWWRDPIRFLRSNASEFHEYYRDAGFTGDFVLCIRARCNEDVFRQFARREGLTHVSDGALPSGCLSWSGNPEAWWDPPKSYLGTYFDCSRRGERRLLAYKGGLLYFDATTW